MRKPIAVPAKPDNDNDKSNHDWPTNIDRQAIEFGKKRRFRPYLLDKVHDEDRSETRNCRKERTISDLIPNILKR